ncbi:hypothetical protein EIN_284740 [Entamoeba invadens IP1]|uniref:AP180 N-terminal homology (ANTH) domain-containing protein n=2 Tax=Entamoeba invadens TaxID=33085 RepID=L7FM00_ENTIV|nr:hypothetical protein EIN_284740 [Entamoeba invadens IP1]ELP84888.1 hypothetical protein EIN_284740 [Entamoeba invadens IP1]BAN40647.1 hypothetical protein [Entamoeba invadens]|eukprot:XP_004184234.1 hypothetical protein EIN_284740 [Entamoeba invadens IP1]
MNFIELHYALEYYFATTELHEKDTLNYFEKCSKPNDIKAIIKKVIKVDKEKDTLRQFKALLLFHLLSQTDNSLVFERVTNIEIQLDRSLKLTFEPNTTHLSYWGELYSVLLQKILQFHKDYSFLTGYFTVKNDEPLPKQFRISQVIEQLEGDVFVLYEAISYFVTECFEKKVENTYLQKAVEYFIIDMVHIYELILNLDNYYSIINGTPINTEKSKLCLRQLTYIKNEKNTKIAINKILRKLSPIEEFKKNAVKLSSFKKQFPLPTPSSKVYTTDNVFPEDQKCQEVFCNSLIDG